MYLLRSTILPAAVAALGLGLQPAGLNAGDPWRQIGYFRSDTRNISVGRDTVRVVTQIDPRDPEAPDETTYDTTRLQRMYPGWDYHSDLVVIYARTADGFTQARFSYGIGAERKPLAGDPVSASMSEFDWKGDRRVDLPAALAARVGAGVPVVAAVPGNLDGDTAREWAVVVAGPEDEQARGAPLKIGLADRGDRGWDFEAVFALAEPRRAGPLEIRDVTGDGRPDVIFRTVHEALGHFWIEARIFSQHAGLREVTEPAVFVP